MHDDGSGRGDRGVGLRVLHVRKLPNVQEVLSGFGMPQALLSDAGRNKIESFARRNRPTRSRSRLALLQLAMDRLVIITTCLASRKAAETLAAQLIRNRLAACVQVFPIVSHYRWKGRQEKSREFRLEAKTQSGLARRTMAAIAANHPYELPEILVTAVMGASRAYAAWVRSEATRKGKAPAPPRVSRT